MVRPRSHSLRAGRRSEHGRAYLITTTTHRRRRLFHDLKLSRLVIDTIHRADHQAKTLCYCLMPDHLHWLMQLNAGFSLASVMQTVKSISAHRIRSAIPELQAPIWQDGYHDRALRREEDLRDLARYVVANPLRAGLVK